MKSFTIADIRKKFGITRHVVSALVNEGFVAPTRGARREYRFSFHDMVTLRMTRDLLAAGISSKKVTRFLRQLRQGMPVDTSLSGMRLSAAGSELVVREDRRLRNANGQLVIDFAAAQDANVHALPARTMNGENFNVETRGDEDEKNAADDWYHAAIALEANHPLDAINCYRRALELDARHVEAYLNLGCLLIEAEQYLEAYAVCQEAVAQCPSAALLHFNFGIVHEELEQWDAALDSYTNAITLDPALADAHYNAARLHESMGRKTAAVRHYSAYRRLHAK